MIENFKTQVDLDISLEGFANHDVETKKVEISWDLDIDMRSWGLKDIGLSVPDQKITVLLMIWGEDTDSETEITLDVKDVEVVRNSTEFYSLAPQSLEFYKGKWKLVF